MTSDARGAEFGTAHRILADDRAGGCVPDADELVSLAGALRGPGARRLQRGLLALALDQRPQDTRIAQKLALSTYKDTELGVGQRLERALEILRRRADLDATDDQETLGQAGAIHKDRWELTGDTRHLFRALDRYGRAHELHVGDSDYDGYPGVNAAFVLDLIAEAMSNGCARSEVARDAIDTFRAEANQIRKDIVDRLTPRLDRTGAYDKSDYWQLVTVAEALLGQGGDANHRAARVWMERAASVEPEDWMRESSARQLARIAQLQGADLLSPADSAAQALAPLLPKGPACLRTLRIGKVGLALSGGGFRASLFHIGVLARLAELDVLRHIEALSCVSGGSIVGADYYLRLRARLEHNLDGTLGREDYIALVEELAAGFRHGVDKNLRVRLMTNPLRAAKMLGVRGYNRTTAAGELYEKLFYRPAGRHGSRVRLKLPRRESPLRMRDLRVQPLGEDPKFRPQEHNWRRLDKVPVLIINAASLNTGHSWQFTASWMGEPPSSIDNDVDRNVRLRRMYYSQAPAPHDNLTLGTAVAASAAVPGIFPPITLAGLYPGITVRLADGGAHDNQGVAALAGQDCTVMIVSDASGQMHELPRPRELAYDVLKRASSLLSARVRRSQWEELASRAGEGILRGLMFLHLRAGLGGGARDWIGCQDPQEDEVIETPSHALTGYGMRRDVQAALARMRTDLDRFSAIEADALMTSGYRMATHEFGRCLPTIPVADGPAHAWSFVKDFDSLMADSAATEATLRVLEIGEHRWLRPARRVLRRVGSGQNGKGL